MIYKRWQDILALLLSLLVATGSVRAHAQTNTKQQSTKNGADPSSTKWIENKVLVRVDSPYLSDSGNLVLAYTLTNKSGQDIQLTFGDNAPISLEQHEPLRVFLKLKNPDNYAQVAPKDHLLYLPDTLLAADLPVSFHVVLTVSSDDKPSWFSSESAEDRLWRLLQKKLGNTESIALFIPDRQIKITLPIPSSQSK
ncbi:MAG TPA: hypothetical protein VGS20_10970 [Candidatus Acidoferrales bacterium]|nr:hypothetical protein [Candidatus Acidoferrales bacterium]